MDDIKGVTMKIYQVVYEAIQYISEAASRIFGPNDDHYPATGTQPFEGDSYDESQSDD